VSTLRLIKRSFDFFLNVEPPLLFSCRLNLFILLLFATLNIMLLRSNINMGLVCMVKAPRPHFRQNQTLLQEDDTAIPSNFTASGEAMNEDYDESQVDSDATCEPEDDLLNRTGIPSIDGVIYPGEIT